MNRLKRSLFCHLLLLGAMLSLSVASAKTRADCERVYTPRFGQAGKDVPWEPTSPAIATAMLKLAKVLPTDLVYDLGAGDGSIVRVAAKQFGASAVGIEYNANLAKLAQCYIEVEGLQDRAKVMQGDIFKSDFSKASVVTLFLYPELNLKLRPTLLEMKPGTRIVSHMHRMGDWKWDDQVEQDGRNAYLWIVPAKLAGTWNLKAANGETISLTLKQDYQELKGDATLTSAKTKVDGTVRGTDVVLNLRNKGTLIGKFESNRMTLLLSDATGAANAEDQQQFIGVLAK